VSAGSIVLPTIHRETLPNGLTLMVARRGRVPLAAVRLILRGGASQDPAGRSGLAHLVSETIRRGTRKRSGPAIDEEVEGLGAELITGSDEDAAYVGLSAPLESLPKVLDVVLDVAAAPTFPTGEVERIRRRELASLVHDLDEPGLVADRAMLEAAYGSHPYAHPVEGRIRDLRIIRRGDLSAFHRKTYQPAATTLVVVYGGSAPEPEQVMEQVRRRAARWKGVAPKTAPVAPPPPAPRSVLCVDKADATQSQVRIATPAIGRTSPEYFPALVANAVFGGGFTSRLMQAIRVDRGLSYGAASRFAMSLAGGLFFVSSFTKTESTAELLQVTLDEMNRFCAEGPSAEELARAQSYLAGLYPLSLETQDQFAEKLADMALYGFPEEQVSAYREQVRQVTAAQCREVAQRHFPADRGAIVVVGRAREMARSLDRFGPVKVVSVRSRL
jgi:zinc protease